MHNHGNSWNLIDLHRLCNILRGFILLCCAAAVSIYSFSRIVAAFKKSDLIYIENTQCVHFRTVDFESMEIVWLLPISFPFLSRFWSRRAVVPFANFSKFLLI